MQAQIRDESDTNQRGTDRNSRFVPQKRSATSVTQSETRDLKNEDRLRDLSDDTKCSSICTAGIPEQSRTAAGANHHGPGLTTNVNLSEAKRKGRSQKQENTGKEKSHW